MAATQKRSSAVKPPAPLTRCQSHKPAAQQGAPVRRAQAHRSHLGLQRKEAGRLHDTFPQNGHPRGCMQEGLTPQPKGYEAGRKATTATTHRAWQPQGGPHANGSPPEGRTKGPAAPTSGGGEGGFPSEGAKGSRLGLQQPDKSPPPAQGCFCCAGGSRSVLGFPKLSQNFQSLFRFPRLCQKWKGGCLGFEGMRKSRDRRRVKGPSWARTGCAHLLPAENPDPTNSDLDVVLVKSLSGPVSLQWP